MVASTHLRGCDSIRPRLLLASHTEDEETFSEMESRLETGRVESIYTSIEERTPKHPQERSSGQIQRAIV